METNYKGQIYTNREHESVDWSIVNRGQNTKRLRLNVPGLNHTMLMGARVGGYRTSASSHAIMCIVCIACSAKAKVIASEFVRGHTCSFLQTCRVGPVWPTHIIPQSMQEIWYYPFLEGDWIPDLSASKRSSPPD